jgi:hypothetical protein
MGKFLKEWGWFIVFVFFGEAAYSDGSFALSVKKDIKPELPIVVIDHGVTRGNLLGITPEFAGALAVMERVLDKHKFIIVGKIDSDWVFFKPTKEIQDEANKEILNGINKFFGG